MHASEIKKKTTSVQELMTSLDERLQKKFAVQPTCNNFEDSLPYFSYMHQISGGLTNERILKTSQILKIIHNLQETTKRFDSVSYLSANILKSLKYIVDSSNMVVHLLNHLTRNGSIPLSRKHHEDFLQIIKNCLQIAIDRSNRSGSASTINWPIISSVLKPTINMYKQTAEFLDSGIQEHHLLQLSTMKMLEQTSKLCFH